jgi:hypothetical protein
MEISKLRRFGDCKLRKYPPGEKKNIQIRIKTAPFWLKLGFLHLPKRRRFVSLSFSSPLQSQKNSLKSELLRNGNGTFSIWELKFILTI